MHNTFFTVLMSIVLLFDLTSHSIWVTPLPDHTSSVLWSPRWGLNRGNCSSIWVAAITNQQRNRQYCLVSQCNISCGHNYSPGFFSDETIPTSSSQNVQMDSINDGKSVRRCFADTLLVSIAEYWLQKNEELIFQLKDWKPEIQTSTFCIVRGGQSGYSMTTGVYSLLSS